MTSVMTFGPLQIEHDDRVLRPRPWTEMQGRWAAEIAGGSPGPLLELCSGAGHIGLLAAHLSGRALVAVDIDPAACAVMADNARRAGLDDQVEIRCLPLADALVKGERFAVAIADPPWVATAAVADYPDDPTLAIDGGEDGLQVARACVRAVHDHLDRDGRLLVQLGDESQAGLLVDGLGPAWRAGELRHGSGTGAESASRGVVQELVRT